MQIDGITSKIITCNCITAIIYAILTMVMS